MSVLHLVAQVQSPGIFYEPRVVPAERDSYALALRQYQEAVGPEPGTLLAVWRLGNFPEQVAVGANGESHLLARLNVQTGEPCEGG